MKKVVVSAPAKLNLTLDVTGLLPGGYHALDMIMQSVSLCETVTLTPSRDITLRCRGARLPAGPANIAYKAAVAYFTETGLLAGADIFIDKAVPVRAGMAGGSADAAAVLVGLNHLYGGGLSTRELCRIGAGIGADVPFVLAGGTARVGGIGEEITPLPGLMPCWFTVCMPSVGVSTPEAFQRYDRYGTPRRPDTEAAVLAVREGDLSALCGSMYNALQHASAAAGAEELCGALRQQGALAALMTGSGAAVYGVFAGRQQAECAAEALRARCPRVWCLSPLPHGAVVVAEN